MLFYAFKTLSPASSPKPSSLLFSDLMLPVLSPMPSSHLHLLSPSSPKPLFRSFSSLRTPSQTPTSVNNYNHLIQMLCKRGNLKQALDLLPHEPSPTQRTYEALILACVQRNSPGSAAVVHRHLSDDGFDQDPFISTKLVGMYSHFNALDDARNVFDKTSQKTIFLWNALLRALAVGDEGEEALLLFRDMVLVGIELDSCSYSFALKACVALRSCEVSAFERVREIHGHALRHGFNSRVHVATTLVDCYAKLGCVSYARRLFDRMLARNVVSWSAMIACYAKSNNPFDALKLFEEMMVLEPDIVPNSVTMVSVLQACAGLAALGQGKIVHAYVLRRRLDSILSVVNALITMYVKCGTLVSARRVFDGMNGRRDVVSWNSMISGYGIHGFGTEAIQLYQEMLHDGIAPSTLTFLSILGACSHVKFVQQGKTLFESMIKEHGITPRAEHYACMVDLLGRAGQLDEAIKIIEEMRIEPGPTVWGSLLGACRIHGHVELAERACSHLFELEPMNAGNYVLLADIYAGAKMWEEMINVKKLVETRGLQKVPGCSWIEVNRKMYSFVSVDFMDTHTEELHALLVQIVREMKGKGYIPNTDVVLYDLDQDEKEQILLGHSEKLAVAFGLINCRRGEVIRITKNLRLCEDCHSVTKFISKFARREIIVRDVNRFHHFRDGFCSCSDYW
ncbi:pentatricopeptide repeat-containing protein At3g46790, chloroplastic isoform X1 [Dioscorea cayenensis subsp. rotundata]|uniref:Pentatricopeptide repeat-containing protein At3g46790, chloroplastic isoform X1 n=1 Tax=Dioscorea cayennensis subsp. rotundata TaxID=55577 RepID=A0AB40BZN6_DIOCR|nr:pentatricopeptide repeat-containing protein At3g46790, chloroplastic isoform X1 [Dioscorea cayenensis subsp. rotundata]